MDIYILYPILFAPYLQLAFLFAPYLQLPLLFAPYLQRQCISTVRCSIQMSYETQNLNDTFLRY